MLSTDSWLEQTATDSLGRTFDWLRLLGRGGFGEVYLARMHSPSGLEQQVAVKLLPAGLAPDSRAVVRLRDEARVLASLRHPVVLAPHDLAELAGRVALVTEFIEGEDLASCIDPHDPVPLPVSTQLEVIEQVASALEVAWQQLRLVHRDVKPQNIRIGRHGNVKLLDFGLASSEIAERAARTSSDVLVGTIRYLAPERFDTRRDPTPASDVYSLGCVLFEGVTGTPFLTTSSVPTLVQRIAETEEWERSVQERISGVVDPELRALMANMLAHDPERRPTAAQVRERCELLRGADPSPVTLSRWCRDRRWPDPDALSQSTSRPRTPTAMGHLDEAHLARAELSADETAHVATCVRCRTARRILLEERTGWMGVSSGAFLERPPAPPRGRLRRAVAVGIATLVVAAVFVWAVIRTDRPPPEHVLGVAAASPPLPSEESVVLAPAVEPAPTPIAETAPTPVEVSPPKVRPPRAPPAELFKVWVRTYPPGRVTVGDQTWDTEDRSMRLPAGKHRLRLESYDRKFRAEVELEVRESGLNSVCRHIEKDAPCSY